MSVSIVRRSRVLLLTSLFQLQPQVIRPDPFLRHLHLSYSVTMPPKRKSAAADGDEPAKKQAKPKGNGREKIPDVDAASLASDAKTEDGKKWNLKIASWNINGIRAWVEKEGYNYIKVEEPDIIGFQETKCNEEKIPAVCNIEGYHSYWSSAEKEGYAGTGLLSKVKPLSVRFGIGIEKHDDEGRTITAEYEKFYYVTSYVPNAGRGLVRLKYRSEEWDVDFRNYLKKLDETKPVVMCGDLNVAHSEIDIANPKSNKKSAGFTKEERDGFTTLLEENDFVDSFRHLYPDKTGAYSFWTYMGNARGKNVGWRLDYFVISKRLVPNLCDSLIRSDVMGSDHCPIVCLLAM
ncbi:DNA repair nuclease/redox regulator APEX1-like [Lineus longissimus]|uniref:DNA repair nuclease/redox regulator APEX1-like n=1 Tax=Lineus longissimus TaxID=88925 RepID=UPI002B4C4907